MSSERVIRWLVLHIPEPVLTAPERVLINFACAAIGLSGLIGARPGSLLALWPRWVVIEWAAAMFLGGLFALVGYWAGRRSMARLGYLLIGIASVVYGVAALVVFGWEALAVALIFLGVAVAKGIRLLVGSAIRNSIIAHARGMDRP